jgi:hypothetical protein
MPIGLLYIELVLNRPPARVEPCNLFLSRRGEHFHP